MYNLSQCQRPWGWPDIPPPPPPEKPCCRQPASPPVSCPCVQQMAAAADGDRLPLGCVHVQQGDPGSGGHRGSLRCHHCFQGPGRHLHPLFLCIIIQWYILLSLSLCIFIFILIYFYLHLDMFLSSRCFSAHVADRAHPCNTENADQQQMLRALVDAPNHG